MDSALQSKIDVMALWAKWQHTLKPVEQNAGRPSMDRWTHALKLIDAYTKLPHSVPRWAAVEPLIERFDSMVSVEAERFEKLYARSKAGFLPLTDPLDISLSFHRRMSWDREEIYSDWLQWTLEQIGDLRLVAKVLGAKNWVNLSDFEIVRQIGVEHGHENQSGRVDLVIRSGSRCIAVIEVKTRDYEALDLQKHKGYINSLGQEPDYIFLTVDPQGRAPDGFRSLAWADVCIELRKLARQLLAPERVLATALILSFVGAIEQNLLGFHSTAKSMSKIPAMAEHFTKALQGDDGGKP